MEETGDGARAWLYLRCVEDYRATHDGEVTTRETAGIALGGAHRPETPGKFCVYGSCL